MPATGGEPEEGATIRRPMNSVNYAQPDVTLVLDMDGVIRRADLSNAIADESTAEWMGRPWIDTVGESGAEQVRRMVEDARTAGVSAFHQITQRFPSGREVTVEYNTVRLGGQAGMIAVGRNLQAVAELRTRLIAAQQAMEQDYWKLREIETRYRLLFDASNEPVLLIGAEDLRVVEANPAAIRAIGVGRGREMPPEIRERERDSFLAMLQQVREHGKAPGILVHLGADDQPWIIRGSLLTSEAGPVFLLQLASIGVPAPEREPAGRIPVDGLIEAMPDGFVVVDPDGTVRRANRAFLDMVEVAVEAAVLGEPLGRWLTQPGADAAVLLGGVARHRDIRLLATTIRGELGSETAVEISAAAGSDGSRRQVGVLVRNVGRRLAADGDTDGLESALGAIAEKVGRRSLRSLVDDAVSQVERHCIQAALGLSRGNRTAAAEILGLSRQSLYSKLSRYSLGNGPDPDPPRSSHPRPSHPRDD